MSAKRQWVTVVVGSALAAGLAMWTATWTWSTHSVARPAPLPAEVVTSAGPGWLTGCAVLGLAAAGALLASRGRGRQLIGVVLTVTGAAIGVGGGVGLASGTEVIGPLLTAVAGVLVAVGGGYAIARGRQWPEMGARFERPVTKKADMWDAMDRGEDLTAQ